MKLASLSRWDAEGELAKVTEGSAVRGQFVYTADGERLMRTHQFGGQTVAVRTGAGSSGTTTIVADHHGTGVVQVAQASNALSRRYTDPYGQARGAAASWTGDRGFLDKTQDATGLLAVGARYYDPGIGRFVSVDPVMDLSDPQQWNAYSYSNNNPLTWSDPSGMLPIGAGHVGYNPKQKNDPRKYDTCTHATSCIKTENRGGNPVRVRYNYTENARSFFSKPKWRDTSYTVNRTEKYYAASRAAAKAEGAARAAERRAAAKERAERARAEERGGVFGNIQRWAASDEGAAASQLLGTMAMGIGILAMVSNPVGWVAGVAIGSSMLLGAASATIDCVNGMSAGCALGIAGTVTGGAGAGLKVARMAIRPIDRGVRSLNRALRMPGEAKSDIIGNGVNTMSDIMGTSFDTMGFSYSTAQLAGWIKD